MNASYVVVMTPSWVDLKVDELLEEVASLGMVIDTAGRPLLAREIQARVASVAERMRISERHARTYLDRGALREMAAELVAGFAAEEPGRDIVDPAARDTELTRSLAGRAVAALAEALRVQVANVAAGPTTVVSPSTEHVAGQFADLLAIHGLCLSEAGEDDRVPVNGAWLRRAARLLEETADLLDDGGNVVDSGLTPAELAAQFRDDATLLRTAGDGRRVRALRPVDHT